MATWVTCSRCRTEVLEDEIQNCESCDIDLCDDCIMNHVCGEEDDEDF